MSLDLKSVTAGEVYGMYREALNAGDFELAEVLCDLERAVFGEDTEARVEVETRLLPLFLARGVQS